MAETPGVIPPAPAPGQAPGTPDPSKTGTPPAKPEPGAQTDPVKLLAALQEERDRNKELSARLAQTPPATPPASPPPGMGGKTVQQELDELWETDPRRAVQTELMYGFQWYDQLNAATDSQRAALRVKYPDFSQYENQAMSYVRSLPLNQRSMPGVVEAAYFLQKGQSSDQIYKAAMDELIRKMQAGEAIQGLPAGTPQMTPGTKQELTAQELAAAQAMGISPEDYLKYKK